MPPEYRGRFSVETIAEHLRLLEDLKDTPMRVRITPFEEGTFEIVIAARDYFSEFAIITGLLAAFGFDIQEGFISSAERYILDLFRVRSLGSQRWNSETQSQFQDELTWLVGLLAEDRFQEARGHVNRRLTEALSGRDVAAARLGPLDVQFRNQTTRPWTMMELTGKDSPGFLYALANALALRGIIIHNAYVRTTAHEIHDRVGITDRHGHKITGTRLQAELRITTVLIKQFTHCLPSAPDPAKALAHFDGMLDQLLADTRAGRMPAFLREKTTLDFLARLFGTSDFLWEDFLRRHLDTLLPVLQKPGPVVRDRNELARDLRKQLRPATTYTERKEMLNAFKDRELFRIDMAHLADRNTRLEPFSLALSDLAELVLEEACHVCVTELHVEYGTPRMSNERPSRFAICGLGKFGGREMGYASDIEVLFVYDGTGVTDGRTSLETSEYFERLSQMLLHVIEAKQEGIFHLDVRLRPHGGKSTLASSFDEMARYYARSGPAAAFERQALIKLRWVAGHRTLGMRVERLRDALVYSEASFDIKAALELRARQSAELVGLSEVNVKFSPGGLVDIEYAVQYLQIMHGSRHPGLRTPTTLAALSALRKAGLLSAAEETGLRDSYLFLRRVIDAMRIVRGNARDLVLPRLDSEEFTFLARRLGYHAPRWSIGTAKLQRDMYHHMSWTHRFFRSRFRSPSA